MSIAEKLTEIAENVPKVFNAGKDAQWSDFWEDYQDHGNRTHYAAAFGGKGWTNEKFKPKYNIKPTQTCNFMFAFTGIEGDLVEILDDLNIELDLSKVISMHSGFAYADKITRLGVIDLSSCNVACSAFFSYMSSLVTIDELIITKNTPNSLFNANSELVNISITGEIGTTGWNLRHATKLSKASITSFINALSTTTSGLSITFSKTAVNKGFETSEGAADGSTSTEWAELIATKSNWTISLA